MASLKYEIVYTTTQDRESIQNSISHILFPTSDHTWIIQKPQEYEMIKIKFDSPCAIKYFLIKINICKMIKIMLYNMVDENEIQQKHLETTNFLTTNSLKSIENKDSNDVLYQYAQITFYRQENNLSIIFLQVFGQTQQSSQKSHNNIQIPQIFSNDKRLNTLFTLKKPIEKEELTLEIKKSNSQQINMNNSISQRSFQILNKSKQSLSNNNSQQKQLFFNNPIQNNQQQIKKVSNELSEDQMLLKAIEESMKTHKEEIKKQSQKKNQIELEQQLIEEFYEEEEKDNNKIQNEEELKKQLDEELQNQLKFSQQKQLIKQQLFNINTNQVQITIQQQQNIEEYFDLEQMTLYHSNMIEQGFIDFHTTLEESYFRSKKLKNILNEQFRPLQNQRIFIVPDIITDYEYQRLQLKAINLGAIVEKAVTENTTIIISDKIVQLDRKLNINIVNSKFIEHCSYDKLPKIEKFLVK